MGLLQSPTPAIKLARQYGIRGIFTPEIVPSLQPVVIIDDLASDNLSDNPVRIGTALALAPAVANERGIFRFETPTLVIAKVTKIGIQPSATVSMSVFFGSSFTAPATTAANAYTDGRLRLAGESPSCQLSFDTQAAALAVEHQRFGAASSGISATTIDVNWIIGNTTSFDFIEFATDTFNVACRLYLQWEEFDASVVR